MDAKTLMSAVTAPATGTAVPIGNPGNVSFVATVAGTGAVTATAVIQVSIDGSTWVDLVTFSLSGTTSASQGSVQKPLMWPQVRAKLNAVTGTGAAVTVKMGV